MDGSQKGNKPYKLLAFKATMNKIIYFTSHSDERAGLTNVVKYIVLLKYIMMQTFTAQYQKLKSVNYCKKASITIKKVIMNTLFCLLMIWP